MIRHAKNPVNQNTEATEDAIRNSESTQAGVTGEQKEGTAPGTAATSASGMTNPGASEQDAKEPEVLVAPNIVPPARPVARRYQPEKELQLKNRITSARMSLLFVGILLVIAVLLLLIPRSSDIPEDRKIQTRWPEISFDDYFSGHYTASIMKYYNDSPSSHSLMRSAEGKLRSLFGPGSADLPQEEQKSASGNTSSSGQVSEGLNDDAYYDIVQSKNYHTDNPDVKEADNFLIVRQDGHWKALSLYKEGDISLYAGTINYIRQMLDESIKIYVMPVPVSTQFYLPSNYADRSADMKDSYRRLSIQLISGIQEIDIIDVLNNHNAEQIYLRTEDHWAPLAAYYAARELTRVAELPFPALDTYAKKTIRNYQGSVYEITGSSELLNDPEDFVYYIPNNRYRVLYYDTDLHFQRASGLFCEMELSESYYVILGKDDQIVKIMTDAGNGRKLLMIKDSYGNAMVPFLTSSFEEIYVVDREYFNFNLINFANYTGITDLLFLQSYNSLFESQAELLEYITYSNLSVEIQDNAPRLQLPESGNPDTNEEEDILPAVPEKPDKKETTKDGEDADKDNEETAENAEEGDHTAEEAAWEEDGNDYLENNWVDESDNDGEDYNDTWENDDTWEEDNWDDYSEEDWGGDDTGENYDDTWEDGADWEDDGYDYSEDDWYEEPVDNWDDSDYYDDSENDW